ncbi:MAG TPA: hypothetical protein VFA33_12155 [Bryobacteraceae bacterium]|nr:hypothetical protein [Bryobacteraceae bacterium]
MEIRPLTGWDAQSLWELRCRALECEPRAFSESLDEHLRSTPAEFAQRIESGGRSNFVLGAFEGPRLARLSQLMGSAAS